MVDMEKNEGEMDFENEVVTLTDEEGVENDFEVIDSLTIDGKDYLALVPVDSEADEYIVLRVEEDENGDDVLVTIDDDEEFDRVADAFDDEIMAEYDYDDAEAPEEK